MERRMSVCVSTANACQVDPVQSRAVLSQTTIAVAPFQAENEGETYVVKDKCIAIGTAVNIDILLQKVPTYGPSMLPSKEGNRSGLETDRKCANKISPSLSSGPIYVQEVNYDFIIRESYILPAPQISVVSIIRNDKDQMSKWLVPLHSSRTRPLLGDGVG